MDPWGKILIQYHELGEANNINMKTAAIRRVKEIASVFEHVHNYSYKQMTSVRHVQRLTECDTLFTSMMLCVSTVIAVVCPSVCHCIKTAELGWLTDIVLYVTHVESVVCVLVCLSGFVKYKRSKNQYRTAEVRMKDWDEIYNHNEVMNSIQQQAAR